MTLRLRILTVFLFLWALPASASGSGNGGSTQLFRMGGSAEWELFHSDGEVQTTQTTQQTFRQRYTLHFTGAIYDFRFNRYAISLDFFRADFETNNQTRNSQSIGFRASTTFFPNRSFPLRLFARRVATDAAGNALADSDRETNAWGAEWLVNLSSRQNLRLLYDDSSYELTSPLALDQRTSTGLLEYSLRDDRRETRLKYDHQDRMEQVSNSAFQRQSFSLSDRTHFGNGTTLLFNAHQTLSDARFSTGETDELTINRFRGALNVPRGNRLGLDLSYDYNDNSGRFVDSSSQTVRAGVRLRLSDHWESDVGGNAGRLETSTPGAETGQDLRGIFAGLRFNRDLGRVGLGAAFSAGRTTTEFDQNPDSVYNNYRTDLNLRVPFGASAHMFARTNYSMNENDTTGVGFTLDEFRGELGSEFGLSPKYGSTLSTHVVDRSYDTFQFGVQDSREVGGQATISHPRGSMTLSAASIEGISDFIPDPAAGGPFVPGPDLVNRSDVASIGANWRGTTRLTIRLQGRLADREFTSIGQERILSYHPELEWRFGAWRLAGGLTHYERDNGTFFKQDTFLMRATRTVF